MRTSTHGTSVDGPERFAARARWKFVIGAAVVVGLGLAGCSGGGDKADAKDESSKSSSKDESADWKSVSEKALVSTDMEMLSDHKPKLDEPSHPAKVELPFQFCDVGKDLYEGVRDSAFQMFDGDPAISGRGFAIDGSAKDQFKKLRDAWTSKSCESYESVSEADATMYEFSGAKPIDAPKDIGEESWFGACYEATSDAGDAIGECRVIFVAGDDAIGEIVSQQPADMNDLNAAFLTLVAAEALVG